MVTYFWLSLLYCPKNCSKTKGIFAKVLQWGRVDVDSVCWNCNTIGSPLLCGTSGGNFPPEIRWNVSLPNSNRCSSRKKESKEIIKEIGNKRNNDQCFHICFDVYRAFYLELIDFYRTRVRSLATLVTHSMLFSRLDWCEPGVWRCQLKTCFACYCCWC